MRRPAAASARPRRSRPTARSPDRQGAAPSPSGHGAASGCSLPALVWSTATRQDPAPAGLRPPDAVRPGWPVDLTRRREPVLVGGSKLERIESRGGLVGPLSCPRLDGIGGFVEQLV